MSVQRNFAQRNNNVTKIVPKFVENLPNIVNIIDAPVYSLTVPDAQNVGGIYYVDMSGKDSCGNLLNYDGRIYPAGDIDPSGARVPIINFSLNIPVADDNSQPLKAANYPGLEFTIFFKNLPYERLNVGPPLPLLTIGIVSSENGAPLPYILSPPVPSGTALNIYPSVTFKSDGTNFNVTSSGPAGWLGLVAFSELLTISGLVG